MNVELPAGCRLKIEPEILNPMKLQVTTKSMNNFVGNVVRTLNYTGDTYIVE